PETGATLVVPGTTREAAPGEVAELLLSWLQLLALDGRLARAEPAAVRAGLLDVPAKLVDHARRRELKLDPAWPAAQHVVTAWDRIQALPDPG
ncbi:hypothetical protein ACFUCH_37570, partial [Streptomyces olivaceus]